MKSGLFSLILSAFLAFWKSETAIEDSKILGFFIYLPSFIAVFPSPRSPVGILPSCETFFRAMSCSLFSLQIKERGINDNILNIMNILRELPNGFVELHHFGDEFYLVSEYFGFY